MGHYPSPFSCLCQKISLSFITLIKLLPHKSSEWSSPVLGPEAKSSSYIMNPTSFTISYHSPTRPFNKRSELGFCNDTAQCDSVKPSSFSHPWMNTFGFVLNCIILVWRASLMTQQVESTYSAGDTGSIPGLGRSLGEGNGNPLQYSCLKSPMDRGAWWATVCGVAKSQAWLNDGACIHTCFSLGINRIH